MPVDEYCAELATLPQTAIDSVVRSALMVTIALEDIYVNLDSDPNSALELCLSRQMNAIEDARRLAQHLAETRGAGGDDVDTRVLFENAWGGYSDMTYDHAVSLIDKRLARSGLDAAFFAGKQCFDGGCGIGRFSISMAKLGASKVVAADIGQQSLDYTARQVQRLGLKSVETVQQDVTDLSRWPAGSFDFVASYGVLHHTPDPIGGLREHFRIVRPGGVLWLYLYGAGGMYWETYDRLRSVISRYSVQDVKAALQRMGLREGLVYTFLDNVLAPRTYHYEADIIATLREVDPTLTYRRATGSSVIDDVDTSLATKFGKQVIGPQGEVRLIITKGA